MESTEKNQLDRIEQTLSGLESRIRTLEAEAVRRPMPSALPSNPGAAPKAAAARVQPAAVSTEPMIGMGGVLGFVAVLCFVLAGAYMVRFALDAGLLTPERQILLAILLGGGLIVAGLKLPKSDYASYLPAGGILVLLLACFGASSLYQLISPLLSLVLVAGVSAVSVLLFHHYRSSIYAILACGGAYLMPYFLGGAENPQFIATYFVPCSLAFGVVAVMLRYRFFLLVSAYLALGLTHHVFRHSIDPALPASFLALHFLLFLLALAAYSLRNKEPLSEAEAISFTPLLLFFYWMEHSLLAQLIPTWVDWLALAFVGGLNLFHIAVVKRMGEVKTESDVMVQGFSALVVLHAFYLNILPESLRPLLFLFVIAALLTGPTKKLIRNEALQKIFEVVIFLLLLGNFAAVLFAQISESSPPYWKAYGFSYTLALLALAFVYGRAGKTLLGFRDGLTAALVAGHVQAVVTLYSLARAHGSLAVSGAWAIYSLVILAAGFKEHSAVIARSSLVVLMIAAGKALLYDVAEAAPLTRILCLLLTGCLLYGTGFLFRQISGWKAQA